MKNRINGNKRMIKFMVNKLRNKKYGKKDEANVRDNMIYSPFQKIRDKIEAHTKKDRKHYRIEIR